MKRMYISVLLAVAIVMTIVSLAAGFSSENSTALWDADQTRDKIVVISDIHLGIDNTFSESAQNLPLLIEFLQRLQKTQDVRELVIAGDFLDEWYLPVYYPSYTDSDQFYRDVIANNQDVIDELNNLIASGIKVVYVVGNHDMLLADRILQEAIPELIQARDIKGLGVYYAGDRKEIAIEHGHRYDVFSAPDTFTNAELAGNENTILPAGYFYARYAATWVIEGRPKVEKDLPVISEVPDPNDKDQFDAYLYYKVLSTISARMTPSENQDEKIFDMHFAGFDDAYTYLDYYPVLQADGTISAPVLFRNIQRTWAERQVANGVKISNEFREAVVGAEDWKYFFSQAKRQYLENPEENVDIVVFGHTHVPSYQVIEGGKTYLNSGTWIDHNTSYPDATRTFAVITAGEKDTSAICTYNTDGSVSDITASVSKEMD